MTVLSLLLLALTAVTLVCAQQPTQKVDVDFYVMAKCPDALACETNFLNGVTAVASLINLNLVYIANQTGPTSFSCMHGPGECIGDQQQLCVRELTPASEGSVPWFQFAVCQSLTRHQIPTNAQECASELGLNYTAIEDCVETQGPTLLSASLQQVTTVNDSVSCTINLNDNIWCQHNGGWFYCSEGTTNEAFITSVCQRYVGTTPSVCESRGIFTEKNHLSHSKQHQKHNPRHPSSRTHAASPRSSHSDDSLKSLLE